MKLCDINPHIRFARYFENTFLSSVFRYCYDCRLFYVTQGSGSLSVGEEIYNFSNNALVFLPPGTRYRFISSNGNAPISVMVFDFDLTCAFSYISSSLGTATEDDFDPNRVISEDSPVEFSQIFIRPILSVYDLLKKCIDEFINKGNYYKEISSALLKEALMEILRACALSSESRIIPQVIEYIKKNYTDPSITNTTIAQCFGYHPYHLSNMMRSAIGETLHSYLIHHRIRAAKDLLISTDMDIDTVAWKCGFNSTSYFIQQFKKRNGKTPLQFRRYNANIIF